MICSKCKKKLADVAIDVVVERKCSNCKKVKRTRGLKLCGECQYTCKSTCVVCGKST